MNDEGMLPDPPIEAEWSLAGFDRIDMPIDWLGEDWALEFSTAGLGAMFRLMAISLRQSPAGSLPGSDHRLAMLMPQNMSREALDEALMHWQMHSDGRRYWDRLVPLIEDAWGRKKGKRNKDALRKRRERLRDQLVKCGLTEIGAKNSDVQDLVLAELPDDARMTFGNVHDAATRAGVIGPVRKLSADENGLSESVRKCPPDSPRTVHGQLQDSPRTVRGQLRDSSDVSDRGEGTTSSAVRA